MSLFSSLPSLPTISLFSSDPNESVKELETLAAENPEQMKELEKTLGKPITNDQELVEARYKAFSAYVESQAKQNYTSYDDKYANVSNADINKLISLREKAFSGRKDPGSFVDAAVDEANSVVAKTEAITAPAMAQCSEWNCKLCDGLNYKSWLSNATSDLKNKSRLNDLIGAADLGDFNWFSALIKCTKALGKTDVAKAGRALQKAATKGDAAIFNAAVDVVTPSGYSGWGRDFKSLAKNMTGNSSNFNLLEKAGKVAGVNPAGLVKSTVPGFDVVPVTDINKIISVASNGDYTASRLLNNSDVVKMAKKIARARV